jgi:II/X family phage/plasmid replication protein
MIDWLTAQVLIRSAAALRTGEVSSVDADGVVEWVSAKRKSVQGSYSGTITVKRFRNGLVEFAGSPAKFLQGHNLFGSDDLRGLGAAMIGQACAALELELLDSERAGIRAGEYDLKRVDINYSFATGSRENAIAWIGKAAAVGTPQNRGKGRLHKSSTVIWGEGSRHWKLKAYSKGKELDAVGHELPEALPVRTQLAEWGNDKLRVELELHTRTLQKLGLDHASSWRTETPRDLFDDYLAKLRLGDQVMLSPSAVQLLRPHLRMTYGCWMSGLDLLQFMPRAKYYRHRKALLMDHGFDIGVPPDQGPMPTMPLSQYLETPCTEIPAWAVGTDAYWQPSNGAVGVMAGGQASITVRRGSCVTCTGRGNEVGALQLAGARFGELMLAPKPPSLTPHQDYGALCS